MVIRYGAPEARALQDDTSRSSRGADKEEKGRCINSMVNYADPEKCALQARIKVQLVLRP